MASRRAHDAAALWALPSATANALLNDTTITIDVVMHREWLMKARLKVFAAIIRFGAWLMRINADVTTEVVDDDR